MKEGSVNQVSQTVMTQRQTDRHNGYQLISQALPLRTLLPSKKPGKSLCRTDSPFHALPCKITASRTKSCKQLRGALCGCAVRVPVRGSWVFVATRVAFRCTGNPSLQHTRYFCATFFTCCFSKLPPHHKPVTQGQGSNFKKLREP